MGSLKGRITFSFVILLILFSSVLVKAIYVQVINRSKLIAYSDSQVIRTKKVYPKRGYILDRNSNPLAVNVKRYNLFTFARNYKESKKELETLVKLIPSINKEKVLNRISKRKNKFSWILRNVDLSSEQLKNIKNLKTINHEVTFSRMYPNHELAAQLIGFVGIDNDGLAGIENYFNKKLKGEAALIKYYKDAKGRPVKFSGDSQKARKADDIILSIDKDIQGALEEALKSGVEKHLAKRGGAAVMDAETGEIWAIANYPTYDPNIYKNYKSSARKLSFVTDPFEPGSVLKSLTIASALERKVVQPDTNFFCERGRYRVQNHYIKESDTNTVHEWLKVSDILKFSSNIGTTKIAFDLTYPALREDLLKFGLGKKTGVEIKGESKGILENKKNIEPLRLSNISFGQGIATTGIQMLATYAPFANGGYYVQPSFIKKNEGSEIKKERIISKKTAKNIEEMLVEAVHDGTGKNARVKFFTIAGKTSTAQRIDETGKYNGYVSGFIGYPVNTDRKFIVFVYVDKPQKSYYGNTVAAPIFKKISQAILYRNKEFGKLAKIDAKSTSKNIDKLSYSYSAIRKVKKGIMPNLVGLDKNSASKILDSLDLDYSIKGFGVVRDQFPKAGEALARNQKIKVIFKAPDYE